MEKSQRRVAATGGWWIFHGNVRLHWLSSVNWWYQAGGHCTAKGHPLVAEEEGSGKETAESSFFHWENEWLVRWNMVYFCFTGLFPSTFCWSLASRSAWICLGSFWSLYCLDTRECYVNFIYIYILYAAATSPQVAGVFFPFDLRSSDPMDLCWNDVWWQRHDKPPPNHLKSSSPA